MAIKLVPSKDEAAKLLREQYSVMGYPTLVLADADGTEVDRLGDFMPPDKLLSEIARIESGDTFSARLERLGKAPGDAVLLEQVVDGYTLRGDFAGIYQSIDAFQASGHAIDPDPSLPLLLKTMAMELGMEYYRAGAKFRNDWQELPDVSGSRSVPALAAFLETLPGEAGREEQAQQLRQARYQDAGSLLDLVPEDGLSTDMVWDSASFAADNGHYERAAELYRQWFERAGADADAGRLNGAAWDLYLCRQSPELAVEIARAAYLADNGPSVADTLARLLYVSGAREEAIAIQSRAVAGMDESEAAEYRQSVELMRNGEELGDRPHFETYPEG